jgi:hypothetical protein
MLSLPQYFPALEPLQVGPVGVAGLQASSVPPEFA